MAELYYAVIYTIEDGIIEILENLEKYELDNIMLDYDSDDIIILYGPESKYDFVSIVKQINNDCNF